VIGPDPCLWAQWAAFGEWPGGDVLAASSARDRSATDRQSTYHRSHPLNDASLRKTGGSSTAPEPARCLRLEHGRIEWNR